LSAGNTRHEPNEPFGAHGPLAPVVVVVEGGRVVVVIDVEVELVAVLVVDGLVDVVGAAGAVVLVVVVGDAPSRPGAPHAVRQSSPVVTDASNSDPRPIDPHRQVA
jgi:hypothetical protein